MYTKESQYHTPICSVFISHLTNLTLGQEPVPKTLAVRHMLTFFILEDEHLFCAFSVALPASYLFSANLTEVLQTPFHKDPTDHIFLRNDIPFPLIHIRRFPDLIKPFELEIAELENIA